MFYRNLKEECDNFYIKVGRNILCENVEKMIIRSIKMHHVKIQKKAALI